MCRLIQTDVLLKDFFSALDFKRVFIPAGKTVHVTFVLKGKNMSFLNERFEEEIGDGQFEVFIGKNCLEGESVCFHVDP